MNTSRRSLFAGTTIALLVAGSTAVAESNSCPAGQEWPCGIQMEEVGLSEVPSTFHLQARISQAQLPVGEGLFAQVFVRVMQGNAELCVEAFKDVRVISGIMNLELGRQMTCNLNEKVGRYAELTLRVCPGSLATCLPAIPLATTGYAVKASWADKAERAWRVERVAQATYAHRVAADGAVGERRTIGTGFFEFTTPTAAQASALYDATAFQPYAKGGFVQWSPTRYRDARTLHIAGKQYKGALQSLDSLTLASRSTRVRGTMTVAPPAGAPSPALAVMAAGLHIAGDVTLGGTLLVSGATSIAAGGLTVTAGGLTVAGDAGLDGALTVAQATTVSAGGLHGGDDGTVTGALLVSAGDVLSSAGGLQVTGPGVFGGGLTSSGATLLGGRLDVTGSVTFEGPVTFQVGHAEPDVGPDARYVLASGETRDLTFAGAVTSTGGLTLAADIALGGGSIHGWRIPSALAPLEPCTASSQGAAYLSTESGTLQACITGEYRPLTYQVCGDGLAVPGEECDDGNPNTGDGCTPACVKE